MKTRYFETVSQVEIIRDAVVRAVWAAKFIADAQDAQYTPIHIDGFGALYSYHAGEPMRFRGVQIAGR